MMKIGQPVLLDLPESFETERLIIRAPRVGDGPALNEAIRESRDQLQTWLPWARREQTIDDTGEIVRRAVVNWVSRDDLWMLAFRKSDGALVGRTGLHQPDWTARCFEIGYWVRSRLAGHGYITEAVNGLTNYAFQHARAERIEIRCDSQNTASAAVARRAGYRLEGTLRRNMLSADGRELRDTLIFSKLRGEWHSHG